MYYRHFPFYLSKNNGVQVPPCTSNSENIQRMNPSNSSTESTMPEYQLEYMYPKIYYIIYPLVIQYCDMFDNACCSMKMPTKEEIGKMADEISVKVELEVEASIKVEMRETELSEAETRQLGIGGRGILRDLVGILLLREFFQRRHRPHRHLPHNHSGY